MSNEQTDKDETMAGERGHPLDAIVRRCRKIIKCDTARISKPLDKMFFIIGFNRNTKDDEGQWIKNGKPFDFNYVTESVVASGNTEDELIASCKEYKRLSEMTMEEYLKKLTA